MEAMILSFRGTIASASIRLLSLGVISHMVRVHWRKIAMALNAEILVLQPDPIPPVRLVRPVSTRPLKNAISPSLRPRFRPHLQIRLGSCAERLCSYL